MWRPPFGTVRRRNLGITTGGSEMSHRSKFWSPLCAAGCMAFTVAGANSYAAEKDATGYQPDVTVIEIMASMVMPTAQKIWDAVGVDVTAQGQIEKKPQN